MEVNSFYSMIVNVKEMTKLNISILTMGLFLLLMKQTSPDEEISEKGSQQMPAVLVLTTNTLFRRRKP